MATKRRTRKKTTRRRKRMSGDQAFAPAVISGRKRRKSKARPAKRRKKRSGIGAVDSTMKTLFGVLLGAGAGIAINKLAPDSWKGKMLSGGKAIAGAGAAFVGKKNPLVFGIGIGLALEGGFELANQTGLIAGMEDFMAGIGAGETDSMTIEMNGLDEGEVSGTPQNAGRMMGESAMPKVISGEYMSGSNMYIPSVVSGM